MVERVHVAIEALHRMPHPVVGRLHGAVAGFGLSLMQRLRPRRRRDDAYFTSAYRHIALTPDGGGSWALPRMVGMRRAMEIMLLGRALRRPDRGASSASSIASCPAAELDAAVAAIVDSLARGPAFALRGAKRLVRESMSRTLSEQLQAEAVSFGRCTAQPDFAEGITAFLEKRAPKFGST